MALKDYFRGRSGRKFWLNVLAAVMVFFALIIGALAYVDAYTHHGQAVQVPDVSQLSWEQASRTLRREGLKGVVVDSLYDEHALPGVVVKQQPAAGNYVKPGRHIALTITSSAAPAIALPDLARNTTIRLAEQQLRQLGFRLTEPVYVSGEPLDLVLAIRQNGRLLRAGEMVSPSLPLTLEVGEGEQALIDSLALFEEDSLDFFDDIDLDEDFGFDD